MNQTSSKAPDTAEATITFQMDLLRRLFGPLQDKKIELLLRSEDIKKVLENSQLSETEKQDLKRYSIERQSPSRKKKQDSELFHKNKKIDILSLLSEKDKDMAHVLAHLGPRVIIEKYGEAVLFWVWFNMFSVICNPYEYRFIEDHLKSHTHLVGSEENYALLVKAKDTMWMMHNKSDALSCLALYDMFRSLPEFIAELDLNKYMDAEDYSLEVDGTRKGHRRGNSQKWMWKEFDTQGNDMTKILDELLDIDEEKEREEFTRFGNSINWEGRILKLYHDSPIGVILKHLGMPIAIVGFSMEDESTVFINQFQQISYEQYDRHGRIIGIKVDEAVKKIKWQETLYEIVNDFCRRKGYKKIVIQAGKNNGWLKENRSVIDVENGRPIAIKTEIPHLSLEIAQKIYDIFAQKNEFEIGKAGNWEKDI